MCRLFQILEINQKFQALLSREVIATQNIQDPFLWLDALQLGITIARIGKSISDFATPNRYDDSEVFSLIQEGYQLQAQLVEQFD